MTVFAEKVTKVVKEIPAGKVMTYKEVAAKAGYPKAHRAVATVMAKNFSTDVPCHRVIKSDGGVGNYNRGGEKKKRQLLESEGVVL